MRTRIKTLAIVTAVASSALIAGAQQQNRPERTGPKADGFNCPVCGSPCVSKTQMIKQYRMRQFQNNAAQQNRPERPSMKRQNGKTQAPARRQQNQMQPQRQRQNAAAQAPARQQRNQEQPKRMRQQRGLRFDIDGDGQLSTAERAALRAYRDAAQDEQDSKPDHRNPRPPVGE